MFEDFFYAPNDAHVVLGAYSPVRSLDLFFTESLRLVNDNIVWTLTLRAFSGAKGRFPDVAVHAYAAEFVEWLGDLGQLLASLKVEIESTNRARSMRLLSEVAVTASRIADHSAAVLRDWRSNVIGSRDRAYIRAVFAHLGESASLFAQLDEIRDYIDLVCCHPAEEGQAGAPPMNNVTGGGNDGNQIR
jgi:hypothetical protein